MTSGARATSTIGARAAANRRLPEGVRGERGRTARARDVRGGEDETQRDAEFGALATSRAVRSVPTAARASTLGRRRRGVGVGAARRRRVHRAASASVQRFAVRQREGGERAQGADRGRRGDGGASRDACARGHRGQSEVTDEVANARRARERGGRRARATHRRAYYRRPAHDGDRGHVRARAGECGRRAAETRDERDAATDANDARRCLGFKRLS